MMGRVNTDWIQSESMRVKDRYEDCIEEHPGVSNRNPLWIVDLEVTKALLLESIVSVIIVVIILISVLLRWSFMTNWVVPRNKPFVPLTG
jgi:hypothetical protein